MPADRFRIKQHVLHQMIDGEVVIINLDTGNYYSLRGSAATVWSAVEPGAGSREIVGALAQKYQTAPDVLERSVTDFLKQLERECLIEGFDAGSDPARAPCARGEDAPGSPIAFEPPVLEKYEDMQDLILLDPVHEVDEEKGWPYAKRPRKPDPKP